MAMLGKVGTMRAAIACVSVSLLAAAGCASKSSPEIVFDSISYPRPVTSVKKSTDRAGDVFALTFDGTVEVHQVVLPEEAKITKKAHDAIWYAEAPDPRDSGAVCRISIMRDSETGSRGVYVPNKLVIGVDCGLRP